MFLEELHVDELGHYPINDDMSYKIGKRHY